ncbi:MAG TPA: hypothetical protein VGX02_09220, partial [Candidatus Eremiobacteraceae bacterium]|nr:hypothetical protein [Candidatus Eremiobacteraceae bacterium]
APALLRIALSIPLHLSFNYNEGWNAYHATEVMRGAGLYPAAPRFFFNNYPPLSFFVLATASRLFGDPIVAGRWISLAAFIAWVALVQPIGRALGCRANETRFAALLFGANTLLFTEYVGINDPELLGHAVAAFGLLAVLQRPRTIGRMWACAVMFSVAVFIKHSLLVVPVVCVTWLMMFDRRAGRALLVAGATVGVAGIVCCVSMFGWGFLAQLAAPRMYVLARAVGKSSLWMVRMIALIAILIVLIRRFPRDGSVALCALYAGIASFVGAISIGGDGVNWNVMFDATWALCLSAAVALNRLTGAPVVSRRIRARLAATYLIVPTIALAVNARTAWLSPSYWLTPRRVESAAAGRDIAFIKSHAGPALCEELALCFWAGKPVEVDLYNMQQRIRTASRRSDELVQLLNARYFSVVQLDTPTRPLDRPFADALLRSYRVDHEGVDGRLLIPQ